MPRIANLCALCVFFASLACADTVVLKNGRELKGDVIGLDGRYLQLQLPYGKLRLKRGNVKSITFGTALKDQKRAVRAGGEGREEKGRAQGETQQNKPAAAGRNNAQTKGANQAPTDDVDAVANELRAMVLQGGGPAADKKFQEMVQALKGGKLDVGAIQDQARDALKQIEDFKETGTDVPILDVYESILRNFLGETDTKKEEKTQKK